MSLSATTVDALIKTGHVMVIMTVGTTLMKGIVQLHQRAKLQNFYVQAKKSVFQIVGEARHGNIKF